MNKKITNNIVLFGNPNAGKSSIFNHLTGLQQKIGNYAGVTVDKKVGFYEYKNNIYKIIDLPGAYSLYPSSIDESVALNILLNHKDEDYPDLIVYIIDANQLERHTLLLSQLIDLDFKILLVLNMLDIAQENGIDVKLNQLENEFGIKCIAFNGRNGDNTALLKKNIQVILEQNNTNKKIYSPTEIENQIIQSIISPVNNNYHKLLLFHHVDQLNFIPEDEKKTINQIKNNISFKKIEAQLDEIMERYKIIVPKIQSAIKLSNTHKNNLYSKIDNLLSHKTWGILFFFLLMFVVFQAIFSWSSIPMDFIDSQFANIANFLSLNLPNSLLTNLLVEGIIPGISGVLIFVPQIFILFLIITFLEDVGYMSRAIYLFDSVMLKFGLNGRSIVALISGGACAVPAIMCTRTISNWKERLITILVTPFISCSARIPVFALLIAFVVPQKNVLGFLNLQAIVFMCLYLIGIVAALGSAYILKKIIKTNEHTFLLLELPNYKSPYWKNIAIEVWNKVRAFVFGAGKIIIIISIILWFLASFGPNLKQKEIDFKNYTIQNQMDEEDAILYISSKKLENSYAGIFGKWIEPIIQPLGFDWKIGIALLTSFAAREVFIGTISTLYSIGKDAEQTTILNKLKQEINPETKQPVFTMPVAMSLIIFYVFAMQCMSTLAIVYKETKSWKYPIVQFTFMSVLAYFASWLTFHIFH